MSRQHLLSPRALEMKQAQDQAQSLNPFSRRPEGLELHEAYALAEEIHQARLAEGAVAVGRKIGFTNPAMWAQYGVEAPIWAPLYRHSCEGLLHDHARCSQSVFVEPKIEPELVLRLARTPAPGADEAEVLDCLDWVALGFEIVQSHAPGWSFTAADTVADAALHGRLFIGTPIPADQVDVARLREFRLDLLRDDTLVEQGQGSNVLGSPLSAVVHLLRTLSEQQAPALRAGELVTTGTLTSAREMLPGQHWRAEVRGLPLSPLNLELLA